MRVAHLVTWLLLLPIWSFQVSTARAIDSFPLQSAVTRLQPALATNQIQPTGLRRQDYLRVVAGIADYFRHFQNDEGRIIDPYLHKEFQYSTPCYAWAAAALVDSGTQTNLLPGAARALDTALEELASGQAADHHEDFFTFPSVLAYEHLRNQVPRKQRKHWEQLLRNIEPNSVYRDRLTPTRQSVHNWNIVALSGEFLRYQDGFTGFNYVEDNLAHQQ